MTEPLLQTTLDGVPDVERLWSVTTLIDLGMGKGEGLITWAVNLTAEAAVDKRTTWQAILEDDGRDEAVRYLSGLRYRRSEKAKVRGTDVHAAVEAIALGQKPKLRPEIEPYVEQYQRWLDTFSPRFLLAEAPVYNVSQRYAGTCDGIMLLGAHPKPLVFDYKTTEYGPDSGKSRPPWPEVGMQLAAYSRAEYVGVLAEQRYDKGKRYYLFDATSEHEPMPEVDRERGLCIVISPEDCFAVPTRIDDEVYRAFLHCRDCARYRTETSRSLFGSPITVPKETLL